MVTLRSNWFSTLWLALALAISGCGGGGGGGGGGGKDGPGPVDPKPLAELVRIEVTPANESLPAGVSQQYTATGVYSDDSTDDITADVTWETADNDIASVSASGMVKGEVAGGPIKISATVGAIVGETNVTVTNATLTSLAITPPSATKPAGLTQEYVATGTYSDGSTLDISGMVSWESSNEDVATVDANGVANAVKKDDAAVTLTATLDTVSDTATLTVTDAALLSIEVTPSGFSLAAGFEKDYTATGLYSDDTNVDLTDVATWSSSDETVATVGNFPTAGEVKSIKKGSAVIQAAYDGKSGSNELEVTEAELVSITATADNTTIAAGFTQQYSAEGHYSDGSAKDLTTQVAWSVSNETFALASNEVGSKGKVTALAAGGPLDVTATSGTITGTTELTITDAVLTEIEVEADSDSLVAGSHQQYTAIGSYSDGNTLDITQEVTWESENDVVAEISNAEGSKGLATAMSAGGPIQISASYGDLNDSRSLTVTEVTLVEILVTSDNETLFNGLEQQYTATGVYSDNSESDITDDVTWSVGTDGETTVASISNADGSKGLLSTLAVGGPVLVTATLDSKSGSTSLTVDVATLVSLKLVPTTHQLPLGLKVQYQVTGTYSDDLATEIDLTSNVTWSSSEPAVASISNVDGSQGQATGLSLGHVTIKATMPDGTFIETTLTVTSEVLTSLVVSPASLDLPRGVSQQYTATATFSDMSIQDVTQQVEWTSSDELVATIDSQGLAKTLTTGSVTIGAKLAAFSDTTATSTLTVNNLLLSSLVIRPGDMTCGRAQRFQFSAFVVYNDGSEQDLTSQARWTSSDTHLASVYLGLVKTTGNPNRSGTTEITATLLGRTDTVMLTRLKASKAACTATP